MARIKHKNPYTGDFAVNSTEIFSFTGILLGMSRFVTDLRVEISNY